VGPCFDQVSFHHHDPSLDSIRSELDDGDHKHSPNAPGGPAGPAGGNNSDPTAAAARRAEREKERRSHEHSLRIWIGSWNMGAKDMRDVAKEELPKLIPLDYDIYVFGLQVRPCVCVCVCRGCVGGWCARLCSSTCSTV